MRMFISFEFKINQVFKASYMIKDQENNTK